MWTAIKPIWVIILLTSGLALLNYPQGCFAQDAEDPWLSNQQFRLGGGGADDDKGPPTVEADEYEFDDGK